MVSIGEKIKWYRVSALRQLSDSLSMSVSSVQGKNIDFEKSNEMAFVGKSRLLPKKNLKNVRFFFIKKNLQDEIKN